MDQNVLYFFDGKPEAAAFSAGKRRCDICREYDIDFRLVCWYSPLSLTIPFIIKRAINNYTLTERFR